MSFDQIILLLTTYKYFFLFPIAVFEGPIVTVIAGFLSSLDYLNLFIAYVVVIAGDIVGDSLYYVFGYYGRRGLIERWGHFLGITVERVQRIEKHFENHSGKTLVIGKLTHAIGGVVLVAAGMVKMPFWKFIWYNLISTMPKSLLFLLIGYFFGSSYVQIDNYITYGSLIALLAGIILVGIYYLIFKMSRKYL